MKENSIKCLMSFMENFDHRNNNTYFHHIQRTSRTPEYNAAATFHYPPAATSHFGQRPPPISFPATANSNFFNNAHQKNSTPSRAIYSNAMVRSHFGANHLIGNNAAVAAAMGIHQQTYNQMLMNHQLSATFSKELAAHNNKILPTSSQSYHTSYLPPMTPGQQSYPRPTANSLRAIEPPLNPYHMARMPNSNEFFNHSRYSGHFVSSPLSSASSFQQSPHQLLQRQHTQPVLPSACNTSHANPQILNYYSVAPGEAGGGSFTPQESVQRAQILKNNPILEKLLDRNSQLERNQHILHRGEEHMDRKIDMGLLKTVLQQPVCSPITKSPAPSHSPELRAKKLIRTSSLSEPPPPVASADSGIASLSPPTPPSAVHIKQEPMEEEEPSSPPRPCPGSELLPPYIPPETANILERLGTQISAAVPEPRVRENIITPAVIYHVPPQTDPPRKDPPPQMQIINGVPPISENSQPQSNTARKSFARMKLTPTLKDKEKSLASPQLSMSISEDSIPCPTSLPSQSNDSIPSSPSSSSLSEMDVSKDTLRMRIVNMVAENQAKNKPHQPPPPIIKAPVESFSCPLENCHFESKSIFSLASHFSEHDEDTLPRKVVTNYECIICHKFKTSNLPCLTYHIHKEIKYKPYQCKWCNSSFVASNFFVRHCRNKHMQQQPTPKVVIDPKMKTTADQIVDFIEKTQSLSSRKELKSPTSNMDDYKFFCPDCGVKVRDAIELQRHLYRDRRYYPYQCSYCLQSFLERDLAHFRNKHQGLPIKFKETKLIEIERTVGELVEKQKFIRVILNTFKKAGDRKCVLGCDYEAPTDEILEMHVICHLSTHPFKCPYCFVTTNNREKMRFHLARYHKKHPIMILETKEVLKLQGNYAATTNCEIKDPEVAGLISPGLEGTSSQFRSSSTDNFSSNGQDMGLSLGKRTKLSPIAETTVPKKRAKSTPGNKKKAVCTKPPPSSNLAIPKSLDPIAQLSSTTLQMLSDGYFKPIKKEVPAVKALLMQRQFLESIEAVENIDPLACASDTNTDASILNDATSDVNNMLKCEVIQSPLPTQSCPASAVASAKVETINSQTVAKPPPLTSRKSLIPPDAIIAPPNSTIPGVKATARKSLVPLTSVTSPQTSAPIKKTARKSLKSGTMSNLQKSLLETSTIGPKARKSFPQHKQQYFSYYKNPSPPVDLSKVYHMLPLNFGGDNLIPLPVKLEELPFNINPSLQLTSFLAPCFIEQDKPET